MGKKCFKMTKIFCLSLSMSQEPYTMIVIMVQICKMIISPCVFFNVKILIIQAVKGLKGQKMT